VVIKAVYHHADEDAKVTLPDRTVITLKHGDTIRLYVSRKYAPDALHHELHALGLTVKATADTSWGVRRKPYRFGLQLMLLSKNAGPEPVHSPARDLFRS
jgi:hypothetical protein